MPVVLARAAACIGLAWALLVASAWSSEYDGPLFDGHIHYSHDAWESTPPEQAVETLKKAGLSGAFVSSSSDEGTQKLFSVDSELVIPVLRPYRARGELGTWITDETVLDMLRERLNTYRYAGLGEFHAFGEDLRLPVLAGVIDLARDNGIFLHAHTDAYGIDNIFARDPDAMVLWAHAGFENLPTVLDRMEKYPTLKADLSFRYEHQAGGRVTENWRRAFTRFPDRFLLGTDTYTPQRWFSVVGEVQSYRKWLGDLPDEIARMIAWENAQALIKISGYRLTPD